MNVDMVPFFPQREPSGLDALAEVSRQLQATGEVNPEDAFAAQLREHIEEEEDVHSTGDQGQEHQVQGHSHDQVQSQMHHQTQVQTQGQIQEQTYEQTDTPASSHTPPSAPSNASADADVLFVPTSPAVNEQLAEAAMQQSQSNAPNSRKRKASSAAGPDPSVPNSYLSYYADRAPPAVDSQVQQAQAHHPRTQKPRLQATQTQQPNGNHNLHQNQPQPPQVQQHTLPHHAQPQQTSQQTSLHHPHPHQSPEHQPQSQQSLVHQLLQVQHQSSDTSHSVAPTTDHPPAFVMNKGLGFGLLQRANKSKARGRFTEERRKEVQSVRKKGACLRCRMLKKPCSEGTPCGTCKNIESARLWKNACIRTRVADEFNLYATTYFYCKDRAKVYASLNSIDPESVNGRIEVTLFPDSKLYCTFPALQTNRSGRSTDEGVDPDLVNAAEHGESDPTDIYLLSFKTEDTLALKLERYLGAAVTQCISSETSPIIRPSLQLALELSIEHDDALLTKIIHLWAATNMLVSKEKSWSISYNPRDSPVVDHITVVDENTDQGKASVKCPEGERIHFAPDSPDYDVMHAQLQDAAERYCQKQAKSVLNEIERRLLQRQQSSTWLTFLGAVILLNCVERMTALYYSFDPLADSASAQASPGSDHASPISGEHDRDHSKPPDTGDEGKEPDRYPDWPLSDPPSKFWPQGHVFANLLSMLLRMRGLPPSVHIHDDGSLAIVSNFNKAYPVEVTSSTDGGDSQQQLAAQWIERTGLRANELWRVYNLTPKELNQHAWGGPAKGAGAWDLKFIAPLLLPQHRA